jgi:hypothetical protein
LLTGLNLWAGTDLAEAIRRGRGKLDAAAQPEEPKVLVLFTDGSPMVCTGPGGGGLCGSNNPATGSNWQPCCAGGLSCGAAWTDDAGHSWGASGWGDGNPNAGASGVITAPATQTGGIACTAARDMVNAAIAEADAAAAQGINLFVIGFMAAGRSADFAADLKRGPLGQSFIFSDPTQMAANFQKIPSQIPVSIVR